jgi:peroxiredoxin
MNTARLYILMFVAVALSGLLVVQFMRLLGPAQAREMEAACRGLRPTAQSPAFGQLPARASDFTVQDHTGKTVKLSDYRGKVVLVNFWASWCEVCEREKPGLEDMTAEMQGDDLVVLALASDSDWNEIKKKLPKGSSFNVLLDPPADEGNIGAVARSFGIKAVPESFLVDREGIIRHYFINKRDWDSSVARTCVRSLIDG